MSARAFAALLCRVLLLAICGYAVWRSVRIAIADRVASAGTLDALERATRFAPGDPRLAARVAIRRSDDGDPSPEVDEDLRRAARMNPLESAVLMTLGLREEFRGSKASAEGYLVRAADNDHQFKPAWTLANYYYRNGRPDKAWPMIQRILNLEPLGFDTGPIFELCWRLTADDQATGNQSGDSRKILSLIPKRGHRPIQYLDFLMRTRRADAALDIWPEALSAADPADASDVERLTRFADFLVDAGSIQEAVTVWNQLTERGVIHAGRLDPARGISIADSDFRFAPTGRAFGWRVADIPGVFASGFSGSVRFEITGDEPQSSQFLSVVAPVVSATRYRLSWKSDGSSLSAPRDPGFGFEIVQQPGEAVTQCPPLLASTGCDFVTPGDAGPGHIGTIRIDLRYARASGTTRVSGVLQLLNVRLEFAR